MVSPAPRLRSATAPALCESATGGQAGGVERGGLACLCRSTRERAFVVRQVASQRSAAERRVCVLGPRAMGGGGGSGRRYVGVVTQTQMVFHDVLVAELFGTVTGYLLDLQNHHAVATGMFASDADALCWLTNPLTREVVSNACCPAKPDAGHSTWLAIVSGSSSAVFELNKTGLSHAVSVLTADGAGVAISRRFPSAVGAMRWRSTSGTGDIVAALASTAGSAVEVPFAGPVRSLGAADCVRASSIDSGKGGAASMTLMQIGSPASSVTDGPGWGCEGAASTASAAPPPVDVCDEATAGAAASASQRRRCSPSPLPLPFGSAKKRRVEVAEAPTSVSPSPKSWSSGSAPNVIRAAPAPAINGSPALHGRTAAGSDNREQEAGAARSTSRTTARGQLGNDDGGVVSATGRGAVRTARRSSSSAPPDSTRFSFSGGGGGDTLPMPAARHHQPIALGPLSAQAATGDWDPLFRLLADARQSTFVSGGPGVGKTTFLRRFSTLLRAEHPADGAVVVCAPMGSSAHSAAGVTYHSFFGFPKEYAPQLSAPSLEAARLLGQRRYAPVRRRLAQVRVLLLDEISMVPADRLDVMVELIEQSALSGAPACVFYGFGDFLQLRSYTGDWAFEAACWPRLFGDKVLELTKVHRQCEQNYIEAIRDARFGVYTAALKELVDARSVDSSQYKAIETSVLHLVPTHAKVLSHNNMCLGRLSPEEGARRSVATDRVALDRDAEATLNPQEAAELLQSVSSRSRDAALADCLAPPLVAHCVNARVMYTSNAKLALGLFHGCIGFISSYLGDGTAVVRFPNMRLPAGARVTEVFDAGDDWLEVCCPPVDFEARIYSAKGSVAVRKQVPFVLGWAITIHRSQSLTLTEAVLDIDEAFEAGMVHTAVSRVSVSSNVYVKSFNPLRLFASPTVVKLYLETWVRV